MGHSTGASSATSIRIIACAMTTRTAGGVKHAEVLHKHHRREVMRLVYGLVVSRWRATMIPQKKLRIMAYSLVPSDDGWLHLKGVPLLGVPVRRAVTAPVFPPQQNSLATPGQ
jgi:hypothetical protein